MIVARPRVLAILLVAVLQGPLLPVAEATHLSPPLPEGLPRLPNAEPTSTCIGVSVTPEVLARIQDAQSIGFRRSEGVPSLCSLDGRPMNDWATLVRQLDGILENYRNVTTELERQYEQRLEYTVPEGQCVPGDEVGRAAPVACPVLRPQVTLLSDRFDGRRLGGFGDWTVVTDGTQPEAWRPSVTTTVNGTRHTWRFGGDEGYPRGAHQWLVSPQIDLGAVRGDADIVSSLVATHSAARNQVRVICEARPSQIPFEPAAYCVDLPQSSPVLQTVLRAYEEAIDDYTRGLLVGQHAAMLSLTLRMNLADAEDGVRLWVWGGAEPPTRVQLYDLQRFGNEPTTRACFPSLLQAYVDNPVSGSTVCHEIATEEGAAWLLTSDGFGEQTRAFRDPNAVPHSSRPWALTGDVKEFTTVDIPLTEFIGQRIWILFEVATTPDTGRGEDYFGDRARFPRQENYGFELAGVRAVGDAWPRNVRLNDVSSAFLRMPPGNDYKDGRDVRTTVPPGEDLVARVHNAGNHWENATLQLTYRERDYDGPVPVGDFRRFAEESIRVLNMRPGETREVRVPWPKALTEESLYTVHANLTADDLRRLPPLSNASEYAEPESVPVRVRNQAEDDGNATRGLVLRAYTDRSLSARHYPPGERGPVLEVCSAVSLLTGCEPLYVAGKGERRTLLVGVRNDGSVPEDATAVLDLRLDGADKSSAISGDAVKELRNLLPGETRPVLWELTPAEAGAYEATVYLKLANGTVSGDPVRRLVFVQRAMGLVCFDDMAANRECGTAFSSVRPDLLSGETVTAAAAGDDGTLYVATATTATSGRLLAQSAAGDWTVLEDLSQPSLDARLPRPRADVGFGSIRDIAVASDGSLHLVGDNATYLIRPPTGVGPLRAVGYPLPPPAPLQAFAGAAAFIAEVGVPINLTGSARGGASPYTPSWSVVSQPEGGTVVFGDGLAFDTNVSFGTPGEYVLAFRADDGASANATATVPVRVTAPVPACVRSGSTILGASLLGRDAVEAGDAYDLTCLLVRDAGDTPDGKILVEIHVANKTNVSLGPARYTLSFSSQNVAHTVTVTWTGSGSPGASTSRSGFTASADNIPTGFLVQFTKRDALLLSEDFDMRAVTVDGCADTCATSDRIGGPETTYRLSTDHDAPGRVTNLRAAHDVRRSDGIELTWSAVPDAAAYVVERALFPTGPWATLTHVEDTFFRDTGVPADRTMHYRVSARDDAVADPDAPDNVGAPSATASGAARVPRPDHRAVALWNGTAFVGGLVGQAWWLNQTSGMLEPFNLTLTRAPGTGTRIESDVRDMIVSPDGKHLHLATSTGHIFVNDGSGALWRSAAWLEAYTPYPRAYDLRAFAVHGDDLYVGGLGASGGVLLVANGTESYRPLPAPEVGGRRAGLLGLGSANGERLFAITDDPSAPIAACVDCGLGEWTFPAVSLRSVVDNGVVRRANLVQLASAAGRLVAIAEGGVVMDYARRGTYANDDDWSTQPALRVRNGTAYQVKGTAEGDQILRFEPPSGEAVAGWTQIRATINHHVALTSRPLLARLFYVPFPQVWAFQGALQGGPNTCDSACMSRTLGIVGTERHIDEPTAAGGWETLVLDFGVPRPNGTGVETPAVFTAIELFVPAGTTANWAVDDVRVEAFYPGRGWVEVLSWKGESESRARVTTPAENPAVTTNDWTQVREPFDIDTVSAWHLSEDLADRPVWVVNNEVYPGEAGGSSPRLLNGWDTRLLTPILDLSEAYDPVISFRHAYAFKTRIFRDASTTAVEAGDGGWVEIQYEKRGEECGSTDPNARCWSAFHTICPDQPEDTSTNPPSVFPAYPGLCKAGTGYPRLKDLGFEGAILQYTNRMSDPYGHLVGPGLPGDGPQQGVDKRPAASFWGRSVLPDSTGVIKDVRDTANYEEVTITLRNQQIRDEKGDLVDFSGRRVRVGFHTLTTNLPDGKWDYKDEYQLGATPTTFPGEGWYITDFKVRGAAKLGMDVAATNLTFDVGYAWSTLGLGPGTRVPVNVTVENRGRFEVPGYTGELEVRRIVDAALGMTEVVATIPLAQQPLLEPGKSRNHTLFWTVPRTEDERYLVRFVASPVGIDRDEDFTDNVARAGSLSKPVTAKTAPGAAPRIVLSPADATKDITRYVAISIDNTGNVVLGDAADGQQGYFRVTRRIYQLGTSEPVQTEDCAEWRSLVALTGRTGPLVDCRTWNTTVPVRFGTQASLASLSSEFNPSTDLYWKPPASADYRIVVSAEYLTRPAGSDPSPGDATLSATSTESLARSFDTYLFDDAESGPRGFSIKGDWSFGEGWSEQEPGFRSTRSYGFGEGVLFRYTADVDTSSITPVVDLGTARSARFAIYHRYKFEPGYDGGVIEASVDGGKSWHRLTPLNDTANNLPKGYPDIPVSPASPLHETGHPANTTLVFTGDSAALPQANDGWILSVFDLTEFPNISESDVPYERYDSLALSTYQNRGTKDVPGAGGAYAYPVEKDERGIPDLRAKNRTYYDTTWNVGRTDKHRYWEVQNLTEDVVLPRGAPGPNGQPDTFWWSGSMTLLDDEVRPVENTWLTIDVRDVTQKVQDGDRVVVDWWEWLDRTNLGPARSYLAGNTKEPLRPDPAQTRGAWAWTDPAALPQNYYINITQPNIVEREGNWIRLQADITDWIRKGALDPISQISFIYSPVMTPPNYDPGDPTMASAVWTDQNDTRRYTERWLDDRGFVIDEFTIRASKVVGGQVFDDRVLLHEDSPDLKIAVVRCGKDASREQRAEPAHTDASWIKLPCTNSTGDQWTKVAGGPNHPRVPATPVWGRTWVNATYLPGVPSEWKVVPVKDVKGFSEIQGRLPPTGETPVAWWTGPICPTSVPLPRHYVEEDVPCLMPGEESRLVTPAFDLSTVAGSTVDLKFVHRYGFHIDATDSSPYPFASGGVVEIQVFDEETGTWSEWKQLYENPDAIYWKEGDKNHSKDGMVARIGPFEARKDPVPQSKYGPIRGGYSAFTVNETRDASGRTIRRDAPFEPIPHYDPATRSVVDVQFLYSGSSSRVSPDPQNPWVDARFPLTDYLGKTVRIGFHVAVSGLPRPVQSAGKYTLQTPDGALPGADNYNVGGWWITDVAIVGKVLAGEPVQLRARAVTDGNVNEGGWQIDDVGIFGAHYGENVGIFYDATRKYGGMAGRNVTIPITIRNLGEAVRDGLAIEVRELSATGAKRLRLSGAFDATNAEHLADNPDVLRLKGYTLAPGQSAVAHVNVTVRDELERDRIDDIELLVELRAYNSLERKFVKIPQNEVQGFLQRRIPFTAERIPLVNLTDARSLTPSAVVGEPLEIAVDARNLGFETVALNLTCRADLVTGYEAQDHKTSLSETPRVGDSYPCARVSGTTNLTPGETATLVYRVVAEAKGTLQIRVNGTFDAAGAIGEVGAAKLATLVGLPPVLLSESFHDARAIQAWTADQSTPNSGAGAPQWSYARGYRAPGSLLLGINETFLPSGGSYQAVCGDVTCRAVSRPVDLHNFTDEDLTLTFWQMVRLARRDGAQVSWQVLLDERRPASPDAWSTGHCVLMPRKGYDRDYYAESYVQQAQSDPPSDTMPYKPWDGDGQTHRSPADEGDTALFFTSENFDDAWSQVSFDLRGQRCVANPARPQDNFTLLGNTVRFVFTVHAGSQQMGTLQRGQGHGWLIDDISLSLSRLTLAPEKEQRAVLLDNTTKSFHLVIGNLASGPDLVKLEVDEGNSSAPPGSIRVPEQPILVPGRTKEHLARVEVTLPRDPSFLPTQYRARILARSVLDPTSVATADLVLDFQPRQWAELGVSVAAPTQAVQEGTETFLPITVENTGVVSSTTTIVRITDEWAGGREVTELELPSMPSYFQDAEEALRVLEFRWRPQKGSIGMHTLTFEVDPGRLGEEYTRTNNVLVIRVPVAELLVPDVDVSAPDALRLRNAVGQTIAPLKEGGVTRYESVAGELVTLEVKVRNTGRAHATNVDVRAFIGPLSLPAKIVPHIGPGEEVTLTFNWVAQKGEYPVEVIARSERVEASAANNRNPAQGVNVLVVKGFEIKVLLSELDGVLEPGTEIRVPFNATNVGNAGEDIRLVPRVPEGWTATVAREELFLRAGETFATTLTVVVPDDAVAGEHFISVDAIARENPMKAATASARADVRAFYGGTVSTTVARGVPPTLTLPIALHNDGNSLEPWTVTVDLPAGWTSVQAMPLRPVVPPHGATTIPLEVRVPEGTPPGERQLAVRATLPDGTRRDGVVGVEVGERRAASVTVPDDRPREAQGALAYALVVQNAGNVAQPFDLVLLQVPEGLDARLEPSRFTLQPGAKAAATLIVTPKPGAAGGVHRIEAFAAFEGVPPDTHEGRRNLQRFEVSVVRPDLRAGQLDHAKAGVETGERVVVKVPVLNDGQAVVTDLPVHLFVNDVFMGETRIARLAPGEKRDVTLNWTARPGEHTVTAVVDPWRDTVDQDTADNAVSGVVEVQSGPVAGLVGGARVPSGGALLVLLAVLAALVVTPWIGARRPPR